jgi:peptide/nickel transport system permease protein
MTRDRVERLGLAILAILALTALGADLLASDLPLACRHRGVLYILPCVTHPAALVGVDNQTIGGDGGGDGWALRPPVPFAPEAQHPGGETLVLAPPSRQHWLGTDDRGRDVMARLIHGTRVAFVVGPLAVALYVAVGLVVGVLAAAGRKLDFVLGRVVEAALLFPTLLLLLAIQGLTSSASLVEVALAIALTQWPHVARLARAEALRAMTLPHVEAARAVGASPARVLAVHVAQLAALPALTTAAFGLGQAVLFESALTFLGFGVPPPTASWGELLAQAQASRLEPWLLWPPTLMIALTVLSCNWVGEGVRKRLLFSAR